MGFYRKKPVVVEAEQFWPDQKPWPLGVEPVEGERNIALRPTFASRHSKVGTA